jgi:RimJ/RimL family protein N-acetyltransferase
VEERVVPAAGGRQIVIRPVRASDDVGLMALYDGLDHVDRSRRFFSSYRPPRQFFTDMATVSDRGGARLVAVLEDRIIGEAGYALLPNGDGEFAITVAQEWRGGLGTTLFGALVETAASAGVPNLEADVLTGNQPMLGVLRSRGAVMMDHEDWTVVRMVTGTRGRVPTWPGAHDRLRVLVEGAGGRWHAEKEAQAAGVQLLTCPGPASNAHGCPALAGEPCPLAADADVIVVSHPTDDSRWASLLAAHADVHAGVPVCVEPSAAHAEVGSPVAVCRFTGGTDVVSFVQRLAGTSAAVSGATGHEERPPG